MIGLVYSGGVERIHAVLYDTYYRSDMVCICDRKDYVTRWCGMSWLENYTTALYKRYIYRAIKIHR